VKANPASVLQRSEWNGVGRGCCFIVAGEKREIGRKRGGIVAGGMGLMDLGEEASSTTTKGGNQNPQRQCLTCSSPAGRKGRDNITRGRLQ
jgi:hypothetical protein